MSVDLVLRSLAIALASPHDGEAEAALSAARRLVKARNINTADVLKERVVERVVEKQVRVGIQYDCRTEERFGPVHRKWILTLLNNFADFSQRNNMRLTPKLVSEDNDQGNMFSFVILVEGTRQSCDEFGKELDYYLDQLRRSK